LAGEQVPAQEQLVSRFEPPPRVRRRHQTGTPVEFGRQVVRDAVDGGIVTRLRVWGPGEVERYELAPAVAHHRAVCGRLPDLVTGDRGLHVPGQDTTLEAAGVRHVVVPAAGRVPAVRRALERTRAWRPRAWRGRPAARRRVGPPSQQPAPPRHCPGRPCRPPGNRPWASRMNWLEASSIYTTRLLPPQESSGAMHFAPQNSTTTRLRPR
jgi:hypothetical protein